MLDIPGHKTLSLIIFVATYAGMALGGFPRMAIDRTGIALLGAIAMVVSGVLDAPGAVGSIDVSTIVLLFSLMVVSAQLRLAGFYTKAASGLSKYAAKPARFLMMIMLTSAALSALLANDIICLAFTPVLCVSLLRASLNPVPFLLGLAISSNIGSAATIIGNPQNMLIGQTASLNFGKFLLWCGPPSVLSLIASYFIILWLYRGRLRLDSARLADYSRSWPEYNAHQTRKGLILTALIIALFFTSAPREITAATAAGILLMSRSVSTREILGLVDWMLITLFVSLFIVMGGIERYGFPAMAVGWLNESGFDLSNRLTLGAATVVLSNVISNVPAVMLLVKNAAGGPVENLYLLALISTFAGNLLIIGSIANLIVLEQARPFGVSISLKEHARTGAAVTLISCLIALLWAAVIS